MSVQPSIVNNNNNNNVNNNNNTQQVVVINNQPIIAAQPAPAVNHKRDWSSGICGCIEDCESCCCGMFFPWCYLCCCISDRIGEGCFTPVCLGCAAGPCMLVPYRVKVRTKYEIKGNMIRDCCCSWFCFQCSVCQLAREVKYIEKTTGGRAFPHD